MPPKARAQRSKKAAPARKDSEPVQEESTAVLTGPLQVLPTETLLEVMSLCEPLPLLRFLASSKALTDMARLNEATLYRRLYHRVLAKESRLRSPAQHCLYAPIKQKAAKKGSGAINYPISDPLPLDAVRSWKVQWTDTVRWYGHIVKAGKRDMRCMDCGAGKHDAVISEISEWNMRFCLLCYAKNIVTKSNIDTYQLTELDIRSLPTIVRKTEGGLGQFIDGTFYAARHLMSLAIQKHGKDVTVRAIGAVATERRTERDLLVNTVTLLHGGVSSGTGFAAWLIPLGRSDIEQGRFDDEFNHYIKSTSYSKNSPWKKDKRSIEETFEAYATLIAAHADAFPIKNGVPFFIPAANPGPSYPSAKSVQAYTTLKAAADAQRVALFFPRRVDSVRMMQAYVQDPDHHDLDEVISHLRRAVMADAVKSRTDVPRVDFTDISTQAAIFNMADGSAFNDESKDRLTMVNQLSILIAGTPLYSSGAVALAGTTRDGVTVDSKTGRPDWMQDYFTYEVIKEPLLALYKETMKARKVALARMGRQGGETSSDSPYLLNGAALILSPVYTANVNIRAIRLADRTKVSREVYEKSILKVYDLYPRLISQTALIATLHQIQGCPCWSNEGRGFCVQGECWYNMLVSEMEDVENY